MKQWDYLKITSFDGHSWSISQKQETVTGFTASHRVTFDELGSEGWELAAIHEAGGGLQLKSLTAVFKRPREDN